MFTVKLVFGSVCSGKTTFANSLAGTKVEVGDIVRSLTKTDKRIFDRSLDKRIADHLISHLSFEFFNQRIGGDGIVIVGIRQLSIMEEVCRVAYAIGLVVEKFLIRTDPIVQEQRFNQRASDKDSDISFQEAISKEIEIGYGDLLEHLMKDGTCFIFTTQT